MSADQPIGAGRDRLEHRLHVRRRAGDHLQDVGGRGLPLQRLFGFVEQPRIFDGDDGLVGKSLQQLNVVRGECTGLLARHADHSDGRPVTPQRDEEQAAEAAHPPHLP